MNTADVANTIVSQLGQLTLRMLGAKDLVAIENGLQFGIRGSKVANKIVIKLDPSDTYTVQFWTVRGAKMAMRAEVSDVYVDSLHTMIETHTGLYTRL